MVAPLPASAFEVVGDAIPLPLSREAGDAGRGRAIALDRRVGLCLLCHSAPGAPAHGQGDLAPTLAGAGSRWSEGQIRLRLVDGRRLNPATIMPSYYATEGGERTGAAWRGKTLLSAQQIEDVVAYLVTLKDAQ